ncbi:hypothetical protein [Enterovirga sp.]|uniref:hypothetical protein n=1 Tax=Enterovirga sp. TaxID=2026350 RepID=UPI002606073D|nr:hypothetical protein [Enterovirga sp.]MDB5592454.1 Sel1 domain protein repeat-containing protein [Enterovirga sp.]
MTQSAVRPEELDTTGAAPSERPARAGRKQAVDYDALLAVTGASERRAIETATKTAAALGSVASWIERAQEQLAETAAAASRAQEDTAATITGVVDTLGQRLEVIERKVESTDPAAVDEALRAIQRIETRLSAQPETSDRPGPSEFDQALRSFESRIQELSDRIGGAKPLGRRGLTIDAEVLSAVTEIRQHQGQLEAGPLRTPAPAGLPALGTLARSQTAILTTLKADVARIAGRLDEVVPAASQGADALRGEIATLRSSVATRDDLDRLEQGIKSLTADIAELRVASQSQLEAPELQALQAEIRRLADQQVQGSGITNSREMEILSHKLDIIAASGVDPAMIGSLTHQVGEVRDLLTSAAAPQALSLVSTHLADLKREVAELGGRQIDAGDFADMRAALDEVQRALQASGQAPGREMAQAVREVGQPIETMLCALIDKLDRVERRIQDPDALDHLERQIQGLASRIEETQTGRDPALGLLERSMSELLAEVASWRESAIAAAEHAARTAVAEAAGALPIAAEVERHLASFQEHYSAAEERRQASLATVHATLEDVVTRITSLEGPPARAEAVAPTPSRVPALPGPSRAQPDAAPPELASAALGAADSPQADLPALRALAQDDAPQAPAQDEILLEPGAGRPNPPAGSPPGRALEAAGSDPADIRSSFIAAARRAAQAAAAESAQPRGARPSVQTSRSDPRLSPADLVRRLRRMIDERRRPLLLSAAALVLAIGTLQAVRNAVGTEPQGDTPTATMIAPAPAATVRLAELPAPSVPDPITTQSIAPRASPSMPAAAAGDASPAGAPEGATTPPGPAAPSVASDQTPVAAPPAAQAERQAAVPMAMPPARPAPDQASALPPGIRSAALAGDPVAQHELAVRTAEGRGVPRDPKAAAELFEKAAAKGLAPAQYRTGNIYEKGFGVPRDLATAKLWYRRAAESGNVRAMHNLAVLLADGGGKPDYAEAVIWFTRAAERGVRDSQFNLAVLHARGLGTSQDVAKAYQWLALAAADGDEDAARKRDELAKRLPAPDLARVKAAVERWRPIPAASAANEVQAPSAGWPEPASPGKRPAKQARA